MRWLVVLLVWGSFSAQGSLCAKLISIAPMATQEQLEAVIRKSGVTELLPKLRTDLREKMLHAARLTMQSASYDAVSLGIVHLWLLGATENEIREAALEPLKAIIETNPTESHEIHGLIESCRLSGNDNLVKALIPQTSGDYLSENYLLWESLGLNDRLLSAGKDLISQGWVALRSAEKRRVVEDIGNRGHQLFNQAINYLSRVRDEGTLTIEAREQLLHLAADVTSEAFFANFKQPFAGNEYDPQNEDRYYAFYGLALRAILSTGTLTSRSSLTNADGVKQRFTLSPTPDLRAKIFDLIERYVALKRRRTVSDFEIVNDILAAMDETQKLTELGDRFFALRQKEANDWWPNNLYTIAMHFYLSAKDLNKLKIVGRTYWEELLHTTHFSKTENYLYKEDTFFDDVVFAATHSGDTQLLLTVLDQVRLKPRTGPTRFAWNKLLSKIERQLEGKSTEYDWQSDLAAAAGMPRAFQGALLMHHQSQQLVAEIAHEKDRTRRRALTKEASKKETQPNHIALRERIALRDSAGLISFADRLLASPAAPQLAQTAMTAYITAAWIEYETNR